MASTVFDPHEIAALLQNYRSTYNDPPVPPYSPILSSEARETLASYRNISAVASPASESATIQIKSEPSPSPSPQDSTVALAHEIPALLQREYCPWYNSPPAPSYSDILAVKSPAPDNAATHIKSEPSPSPPPEPINPQMAMHDTESTEAEPLGSREPKPSRKAKDNPAILEILRRRRSERISKRVARSSRAVTKKPKVPRLKITYKNYQKDSYDKGTRLRITYKNYKKDLYDKACDKAIQCLGVDANVRDLVWERNRWEVMLDMGARPEDDGGVLMRSQGTWVRASQDFEDEIDRRLEALHQQGI